MKDMNRMGRENMKRYCWQIMINEIAREGANFLAGDKISVLVSTF